jgi:hypothetical protein
MPGVQAQRFKCAMGSQHAEHLECAEIESSGFKDMDIEEVKLAGDY